MQSDYRKPENGLWGKIKDYFANTSGLPDEPDQSRRTFLKNTAKFVGSTAVVGTVASCAGPATVDNVDPKYRETLRGIDNPPASIRIKEVNDYLSQSKELPWEPETNIYEVSRTNGLKLSDGSDFSAQDALRTVVKTTTYMRMLDDHGALPHLFMEYLEQITNQKDLLRQTYSKFNLDIANQAGRYIEKIKDRLDDGIISSDVQKLRDQIGKIDGKDARKGELQQIMAEFDQRSADLQNALFYLNSTSRNFGRYDESQLDLYTYLELARNNTNPSEAGENVLKGLGIKLDLETIAKEGTRYDMRKATHPERRKIVDALVSGRIKPYDARVAWYRVSREEGLRANSAQPDTTAGIEDIFFVAAIIRHASQAGGYEGIEVKNPEDISYLILAAEAGATDAPINMNVNKHRAVIGGSLAITLGMLAIAYFAGASSGGNRGHGGGVASVGGGSGGVSPGQAAAQVLTGGRGPRTGGAGTGTR